MKSSVQRTIRQKVLDTYPLLEPYIEDIMPKKEQLDLVKLFVTNLFIALTPLNQGFPNLYTSVTT